MRIRTLVTDENWTLQNVKKSTSIGKSDLGVPVLKTFEEYLNVGLPLCGSSIGARPLYECEGYIRF
jgi:hypothetical protein